MTLLHPLEFSAATHPGLKRDNNEDCFLSVPESGLWLVADGMGGHEAGEVASAIVRDTMDKLVHESKAFSLDDAIQLSHRAILASASKGIGANGMGSTVVALLSYKKNYQVAWVGDSRAYLWTRNEEGGQLTRLSNDHSYVQMLFSSGAISADEVDNHPDKNIITQCLGMQELHEVNVDLRPGQWQKDQWILLCSDGLSDELSDAEIAHVLKSCANTSQAVNRLLNEALQSGGSDNITVQIIASPISDKLPIPHKLWNWIPNFSNNRKLDALIFGTAIVSLLALFIVTLL